MAKTIKQTLIETYPKNNLNIARDETLQASADTNVVFMRHQYRVKRMCTKTDNNLKAIMVAHLETRAREQESTYTRK